ncbi:MAG: class I SAM-dependent methyltransferase [Anaerolineae bacterium]|nr:class I SAM-dependent methyltransferase [Anaerolineae bacterium]
MPEEVYDLSQGWNSLAAELLYACMPDGAPAEELAFYERRIRANGGLALDQACGTGRHLFPLLARGLDVHGADISADALHFARKEAQTQKVTLALFHQRMEACDLPHQYGTIYIANGTFEIITDRHQALATLQRFWHHLVPGGQLLLELSVPLEVTQGPTCNDAEHPIRWDAISRREAEGEIVTTLWSESVDLFEQVLLSKRRYDLYVGGACIRSEVHAHFLRWYFHYEFFMVLERVGFEDITTTPMPPQRKTARRSSMERVVHMHHEVRNRDST